VHAVRGERERYRPLRSRLVAGHDPVEVARGLRSRLGLDELYVADLDAIGGWAGHDDVLVTLAREARVMVDAGSADVPRVRELLDLGVTRVVIGTETLAEASALGRLRRALPAVPPVLSLDLRAGRVLSRDAALAGLPPLDALALLAPDVREVIVLDLARVGSGAGPDLGLVREIRARFPALEVLAGGGVRDAGDLVALRAAGAAGALVASALHSGAIGPEELPPASGLTRRAPASRGGR
jgi:phosphoribosylformimino-5-aminoimidazole carboxamide ribotide isomerase